MQDDVVEVTFCDLCGASVPVGDLDTGAAVRHAGKVIGVCCLMPLRGSAPAAEGAPEEPAAMAEAAEPAAPAAPSAPRHAQDVRLLSVAVVLLAALAAATLFLDHRLTTAETAARSNHEQLAQAQRSDSDVLQAIGVAMDTAARRADVEGLATRFGEIAAAMQAADGELRKQLELVRHELNAVSQEQRAQAARIVDVRPQLEELQQRQQRLMEVVVAMRSAAPPGDASATPPAVVEPATPPQGGGPPALPEQLANQVKNLRADDAAVRFEAVDELLRSKEPAVLPHLLPLARDPDSLVRRLTVEGLGSFKRPEAVEALLVAMTDGDDSVREAAWRSLKEVTGQKFPFESGAVSKDARARALARWQEWWDKNKATFGS